MLAIASSSQAQASHPSRAKTLVGVVMCRISAYPLLSAYCHSVYRYKRMRLLTRVYGNNDNTEASQYLELTKLLLSGTKFFIFLLDYGVLKM